MTEDVPPLQGAQNRIRNAFLEHDQGLFVLGCTAGFGKSMTVERVGAHVIANNAVSSPAPEDGLCVVSFSRDDAASITPGITAALAAFADDDRETATTIDRERATRLQKRVRQAAHIGTIDSIFRSVFTDIYAEYGFDDMPTVGADASLSSLRDACLEELRGRDALADTFDRLDTAYSNDDTRSRGDLDTLLETARSAKRARRLSDEQFRARLGATVDDAYPNGRPESVDDVVSDVAQLFDADAATTFAQGHDDEMAVLDQSQACFDTWRACIADFCSLVAAYKRAYDRRCRERGVLGHQDVAYWIADFFETQASDSNGADQAGTDDDTPSHDPFHERVRQRHAEALQTLLIDEAQDVSVAQHDALAPLVPDDARVLLAGDVNQCIYAWRDARPELFTQALEHGDYFGRSWSPHERADASRTYRMRPDISATVDAVFGDVFTDPTRGAVQELSDDYTVVETARDETTGPSVHIAAYQVHSYPGTSDWFEQGESEPLANYIHGALSKGEFAATDSDTPLTVLFPTRTNMRSLGKQLAAKGLSVADASQRLFDTALVELIVGVIEWLVDPFDPERTRRLIDEIDSQSCHDGEPTISEIFAEYGSRLDKARADDRLSADATTLFAGLTALRNRLARRTADPGTDLVVDVIETLALETDPLDQTNDPHRCLAILDTLIETVAQWEQSDRYAVGELSSTLNQYRTTPSDGPVVPVPDASEYDVVFRTIHNAKGDEADVVCLADLSRPLGVLGPHDEGFIAHGETLALAPPTTSPPVAVDQRSNSADQSSTRLRWASNRWVDDNPPRIGGPPALGDLARAHRADNWRTLYVAMTRAREHLVLSLPKQGTSVGTALQDSWISTIRETLDLPETLSGGPIKTTVQRSGEEYHLPIGCLDVAFEPSKADRRAKPTPRIARNQSSMHPGRTPRFVNGSTLYPLATEPDKHWLAHLKGAALHSDRPEPDVARSLPLDAIGPDDLGTIVHDVLTTAIERAVSTDTLRRCAGPLTTTLDATVAAQSHGSTRRERNQVTSYIRETVCPQFAETDVWERLQASNAVYVEEPLDDVIHVAGHAIETRNHADIVSQSADGTWYVDDIKLLLASHNESIRDRYKLQTAFYAWVLERQLEDETVQGYVTCLGEHTDSSVANPPVGTIPSWLERFG